MSLKTAFFEFSYTNILKPLLFRFDPEIVHDQITAVGSFLGTNSITRAITKACFSYQHPALTQEITGLKFTNPIGLSAGFDKDANLFQIMPEVGFGYMEIGTITVNPYEGNPKPRLVRLPKSKSLIVNFGLKSIGAKSITRKLNGHKSGNFNIGLSVGMTNSPNTATTKEAIEDYYRCLKQLEKASVARFYVINISCPNTFGGEPFTTPTKLNLLLKKLVSAKTIKPIFVKMPINLSWLEFDGLLKVIVKHKLAGVVIGNLNKDRSGPEIKDKIDPVQKGGLSGLPTQKLSNKLIKKTYRKYGQKLVIIGAGGVFSAKDAYQKIRLGASLVSLITGMIYEGPQLIGQINAELVNFLHKDGFTNISQAVGSSNR